MAFGTFSVLRKFRELCLDRSKPLGGLLLEHKHTNLDRLRSTRTNNEEDTTMQLHTLHAALHTGSLLADAINNRDATTAAAAALAQQPPTLTTTTPYQPRGITPEDTLVFALGCAPFLWATVEFWRRIAVGDPFGTGRDSVVINDSSGNRPVPVRRVLGKDAIIAARILFTLAAASAVLVIVAGLDVTGAIK